MTKDQLINKFVSFNEQHEILSDPYSIVWAMPGHPQSMPARPTQVYDSSMVYLWITHDFNPKSVIRIVRPDTDWLIANQPDLIISNNHNQTLIELA